MSIFKSGDKVFIKKPADLSKRSPSNIGWITPFMDVLDGTTQIVETVSTYYFTVIGFSWYVDDSWAVPAWTMQVTASLPPVVKKQKFAPGDQVIIPSRPNDPAWAVTMDACLCQVLTVSQVYPGGFYVNGHMFLFNYSWAALVAPAQGTVTVPAPTPPSIGPKFKPGDQVMIRKPSIQGSIPWLNGMDIFDSTVNVVTKCGSQGFYIVGSTCYFDTAWATPTGKVTLIAGTPTKFQVNDQVMISKPTSQAPVTMAKWVSGMDPFCNGVQTVRAVYSHGFYIDGSGCLFDYSWAVLALVSYQGQSIAQGIVYGSLQAPLPSMSSSPGRISFMPGNGIVVTEKPAATTDFNGFCNRSEHPEFHGFCNGFRMHKRGCPMNRSS